MPSPTKQTGRAQAPAAGEFAEAAALREALRRFQRRSDIIAGRHGLTSRTYQLLLMIKTARGGEQRAGLGELEERLQLGKSTITELVLRSEDRGFLRRELDRDRRGAISISLTKAGENRLAKALNELGDERRHLIEVLSQFAD